MPFYLTQTQVIQRGWTLGLMKRHLPHPDKTVPNPHCYQPYSRPIKLFNIKRIEAFEAHPPVAEYIQKTITNRKKLQAKKYDLATRTNYYCIEGETENTKPLTELFKN